MNEKAPRHHTPSTINFDQPPPMANLLPPSQKQSSRASSHRHRHVTRSKPSGEISVSLPSRIPFRWRRSFSARAAFAASLPASVCRSWRRSLCETTTYSVWRSTRTTGTRSIQRWQSSLGFATSWQISVLHNDFPLLIMNLSLSHSQSTHESFRCQTTVM